LVFGVEHTWVWGVCRWPYRSNAAVCAARSLSATTGCRSGLARGTARAGFTPSLARSPVIRNTDDRRGSSLAFDDVLLLLVGQPARAGYRLLRADFEVGLQVGPAATSAVRTLSAKIHHPLVRPVPNTTARAGRRAAGRKTCRAGVVRLTGQARAAAAPRFSPPGRLPGVFV